MMVDATIVRVPILRNSRENNKEIKGGKTHESFSQNHHKNSQKDTDALWTKKKNVSFYHYKNHIKGEKLYCNRASLHDSQAICDLFTEDDNGNAFMLIALIQAMN